MTTIHDVKVGQKVVWLSPRVRGVVEEVDDYTVKIRWDDGKTSTERKADGFIGWGLAE